MKLRKREQIFISIHSETHPLAEVEGKISVYSLAPLPPGKKIPLSVEQEPWWAPQPVWSFGQEKFSDHAGNQTPHLPTHSLITVFTAAVNLVYFLFVSFSSSHRQFIAT